MCVVVMVCDGGVVCDVAMVYGSAVVCDGIIV